MIAATARVWDRSGTAITSRVAANAPRLRSVILTSRRALSTTLTAAAAAGALLLGGCGSDDGGAGEGSAGGTGGATTGSSSVVGSQDDGGSAGAGGAEAVTAASDRSGLPDGFPADLPIPEGTIKTADATGGDSYLVEVAVEVPYTSAAASYRDLAVAAGWTLDPTSTDDNIVLTHGEGRTATVGSSPDDDQVTTISIAVQDGS